MSTNCKFPSDVLELLAEGRVIYKVHRTRTALATLRHFCKGVKVAVTQSQEIIRAEVADQDEVETTGAVVPPVEVSQGLHKTFVLGLRSHLQCLQIACGKLGHWVLWI